MQQNYPPITLIIFLFIFFLTACQNAPSSNESEGKLKITCTTGMITDAVRNIAGNKAEVIGLMGPGVDPHLYKATQGDLKKLSSANMIIYNGLHLEGKMGEVLEKLGRQKEVYAMAEALDTSLLLNTSGFEDTYDPHIWFDVSLWSKAVEALSQKLQTQFPDQKEEFAKNTATYLSKLETLHQEVTQSIASIPEQQRVLITAHDAFSYFGNQYQIEVRGLQGISTVSEYGIKDVKELTQFIVDRRINAVFVESSVPEKSLKAVVEGCKAKNHEVNIGGTLYSDAMGEADGLAGSYIGMVQENVKTIVDGLR